MSDPTLDRMSLGRRILATVPKIEAHVADFHHWLIEAAEAVQPKHATPVLEADRVVALDTALGRFELVQEFVRSEDALSARIVFFRAPTELRRAPVQVYSVRIYADGSAHFGPGPELDHFEWDHDRDRWAPRNFLRLAYELAVAGTVSQVIGRGDGKIGA